MEGINKPLQEIGSKEEAVFPEGTLMSKEGKPLLLYRGSSLPLSLSKEERYDQNHLGHSTQAPSAGEAFFFTDNKKTADYYSRGNNPNKESAISKGGDPHIDSVYLVMRNPLIHDFRRKIHRNEEETYFNLLRKAKENGHDGAIFKNTFDAGEYTRFDAILMGKFFSENIYAVFNPEQVLLQKTEATVSETKKQKILESDRRRSEERQKNRLRLKLQKARQSP
jgi:hypothetical protein